MTNYSTNSILKVNSVGVVSTFATDFNGPTDIVVDCLGTLHVSNYYGNSIGKVTSQVASTYVSGLNYPYGLALDIGGNIYVSNYGSNTVTKN